MTGIATVRVQVLGCTDYMEAEHLAVLRQLPAFLAEEGITADIHFHEPGGLGPGAVETISLYIADHSADTAIGAVATAAITGAVNWARKFLERRKSVDPEAMEEADEEFVDVRLWGPNGRLLKSISVKRALVDEEYTHTSIDPERTDEPR
jgi:hypothetical protein